MLNRELTPRQKQLYDLLFGKGDVEILDLFKALGGPEERQDDARYAQQWLGAKITRLNRALEPQKLRVIPGRMKSTYAMVVVD